jgi:hypothetical protein
MGVHSKHRVPTATSMDKGPSVNARHRCPAKVEERKQLKFLRYSAAPPAAVLPLHAFSCAKNWVSAAPLSRHPADGDTAFIGLAGQSHMFAGARVRAERR